ncbi:TPA: Dam family site-specific DNA-(adenine-N6)-methyltransferase [Enterobacter hormaechei subsp. xiangfangensis]|nr:Dam family site-specific DNA-(adenine-N6)-methyltransferase [Enterobacter hormaechei subsp. xiangfangensis]HAV1890647.1 Dam family site-specific DNA-(adenine-N6)-methyltransferase [Enterobacter hormaechei subsp. xiangfangensis]
MTYGSVCSGIEAATVAWHPLGHTALWFAQFDPEHNYERGPDFPSLVLAERWPDVPNLGDMTLIAARIESGDVPAPDVIVGGTPCQAYSIAGLRGGLDDPRGALTLAYVKLINVIDKKRAEEGKEPVIIIWENVPGVLNSKDNAFGHFLAGLAGEDDPLLAPGDKWTDSGIVNGPARALAWRILDAQYHAVAQRRRRVFVVGSARTGFNPATVLLESDSVRRDTPPSRSARKKTAREIVFSIMQGGGEVVGAYRMTAFGKYADDETASTLKARDYKDATDLAVIAVRVNEAGLSHWDGDNHPHPTLNQTCKRGGSPGASNQEIFMQRGAGLVGVMAHGQGGAEISLDNSAPTLTCNHEAPIVFNEVTTFPAQMSGTQFQCAEGDISQTLTALNPTAICYPIHDKATRYKGGGDGRQNDGSQNGLGIGKEYDPCPTLDTSSHHAVGVVSVALRGRDGGTTAELGDDLAPALRSAEGGAGKSFVIAPAAFHENQKAEVRYIDGDGQITNALSVRGGKPGQGYQAIEFDMAIRRLTAVEYERLQGFPDCYTLIPVGKRQKRTPDELAYYRAHLPHLTDDEIIRLAADGPRYKALGNSMAVPVMRWIMERITAHLDATCKPALQVDEPQPQKKKMSKKKKEDKPGFTRPFLKWPGGKSSVLDQVLPHLMGGKRLIEPFVGGGSVFLNAIGFDEYLLADTNKDLINLWIAMQSAPTSLMDTARPMFEQLNTKDDFHEIRKKFNQNQYGILERAAAFLYLNRTAFNGLMRYNLAGEFNTSYGHYKKPYFPEDEIREFMLWSGRCEFRRQSFVDTIRMAGSGDTVFCDPPYMPLPDTEGFTSYTSEPFKEEHQWQLLNEMVAAFDRGARVIVTNSGAPAIRENYEKNGFKIYPLHARRSMSCKGDTRGIAADIIGVLEY